MAIMIPPPWPATEDWHFMIYELTFLGMRKPSDPMADPEVNSHNHDVKRIDKVLELLRRKAPISTHDVELVKKVWEKYKHLLRPEDRAVNPPVGHPSYRWPEGTTILPMETFMPEWAIESIKKGPTSPEDLDKRET